MFDFVTKNKTIKVSWVKIKNQKGIMKILTNHTTFYANGILLSFGIHNSEHNINKEGIFYFENNKMFFSENIS